MTKYIKAKRCYICGKLTAVNDGGWLVARRYVLYDGSKRDVFICEKCGDSMWQYVRKQRESEPNE